MFILYQLTFIPFLSLVLVLFGRLSVVHIVFPECTLYIHFKQNETSVYIPTPFRTMHAVRRNAITFMQLEL